MPYARSLLDGTLPMTQYASFLHAVHTVHGELELALRHSTISALGVVLGQGFERRALLERDLAFLAVDLRRVDGAQLQALVLGQRMRLDAAVSPYCLLGHAYVLEGSQLGGLLQAKVLAARPELREGGLAYLQGMGKATHDNFQQFVGRLEAALPDEAAAAFAVRGACSAFAGFAAILDAITADAHESRWLVGELNAEAGTHPIPADVREVQAALRAGETSYARFRYYEARYGERGRRYTRSDSAWLATLSRHEDAHTAHHVLWLARTLSSRGMPRLLLEHHLQVLHDELVRGLPEAPSGTYDGLRNAAQQLRAAREAAVSSVRESELVSAFVAQVDSAGAAGISAAEAATLLVAAVADEQNGLASAVGALTSWLCDPARFSEEWRLAAERTLRTARQH